MYPMPAGADEAKAEIAESSNLRESVEPSIRSFDKKLLALGHKFLTEISMEHMLRCRTFG